jgi:hypothetical protein
MRSFNNDYSDLIHVLSAVNPNNLIPALEQSIEIEKLKLNANPSEEAEERIRDQMFVLNFLRLRRLGG